MGGNDESETSTDTGLPRGHGGRGYLVHGRREPGSASGGSPSPAVRQFLADRLTCHLADTSGARTLHIPREMGGNDESETSTDTGLPRGQGGRGYLVHGRREPDTRGHH